MIWDHINCLLLVNFKVAETQMNVCLCAVKELVKPANCTFDGRSLHMLLQIQ